MFIMYVNLPNLEKEDDYVTMHANIVHIEDLAIELAPFAASFRSAVQEG